MSPLAIAVLVWPPPAATLPRDTGGNTLTRQPFALLALPLCGIALVPLAQAQTAAPASATQPAQIDPAYYAIYDAVIGGSDMEQIAVAGADSIFDGIGRSDPNFAELARRKPQLKGEFRTAALPFLRIWMGRSTQAVRQRVAVRLSTYFTLDEAREVAAFYASPLGHKVMKSVSSNMSFDATVDSAIRTEGEAVPGGIADADLDRTLGRAVPKLVASLTPAERAEMARLEQRPGFRKLAGLSAALKDVEQPNMEDFSTAQEREGFQKAVMGVLEKAMKGG